MRLRFPLLACSPFIALVGYAPGLQAATVVAIITGTVSSGTDMYGNVFGAGSGLSGLPFTIIFTFDDTLGSQTSSACYSNISGSSTLSPGTATLQIYTKTLFPIGGSVLGYPISTSSNSYAERYGDCAPSAAGYGVQVGYASGGYYGGSYVGYFSGPSVYPATNTVLSSDSSWSSSISSAQLNTANTLPFNINYTYTVGMMTNTYTAYGVLSPELLSVREPSCASLDVSRFASARAARDPIRRPAQPVLLYPSGDPVIDPNTRRTYPAPSEMNISTNVRMASGATALNMILWFCTGCSEDYQRPGGLIDAVICGDFKAQYTDVTFYNYGAVAAAAGYSLTDTLVAAGFYNIWFGNTANTNPMGLRPIAWNNITQGWTDQSTLHVW